MRNLPTIMVAPNGARKQKSDHPAIPITHDEIIDCARHCFAAGAGGIHLHVRDKDGKHLLDPNAYRALLKALELEFPDHYIQVSTELAGVYDPAEQFELLKALKPKAASLALAEVESVGESVFTKNVYQFVADAKIDIRHILYSPEELSRFVELQNEGIIKCAQPKLLFVLGRYTSGQQSQPSNLDPFLDTLQKSTLQVDWALCAFGEKETECLAYAYSRGGKMRVGFENSFWNIDEKIATSNHERVAEVNTTIQKMHDTFTHQTK